MREYMYKPLLIRIIVLALFKGMVILLLTYLTFDDGKDSSFLRMSLGGISIQRSVHLIYVGLYALPDFLFCIFAGLFYVQELKNNFVYIFLRTNNRKLWWRKAMYKTVMVIISYEVAFIVFFLFLCGIFLQFSIGITGICNSEMAGIVICDIMKLLLLVLSVNAIFLRFSEIVTVYAAFLFLTVPVIVTGILYDMDSMWQLSVKIIPFHWGNYNYIVQADLTPFYMIPAMMIICIVIYLAAREYLKKYELV